MSAIVDTLKIQAEVDDLVAKQEREAEEARATADEDVDMSRYGDLNDPKFEAIFTAEKLSHRITFQTPRLLKSEEIGGIDVKDPGLYVQFREGRVRIPASTHSHLIKLMREHPRNGNDFQELPYIDMSDPLVAAQASGSTSGYVEALEKMSEAELIVQVEKHGLSYSGDESKSELVIKLVKKNC